MGLKKISVSTALDLGLERLDIVEEYVDAGAAPRRG
jgi:hypothetical protein